MSASTITSDAMSGPFEFLRPKARFRWGASFIAVVAVHAAAAAAFSQWHREMPPVEPAPAALMIDMTPLSPTPPAPPQAVVKPEEIPEIEKAEVVIHKRKPKKIVEVKKPVEQVSQATSTAPSAAPARGAVMARPAPPSYLGQLMGHLEQYKRYPANAQRLHHSGKVFVRFKIDRRGHVLQCDIERGSGHEALDKEALATVYRADPLPPPPPEMPQDPVDIRMPISWSLK